MKTVIHRSLAGFILISSLIASAHASDLKSQIVNKEADNQIKRFFVNRLKRVSELHRQCNTTADQLSKELGTLHRPHLPSGPVSYSQVEGLLASMTIDMIAEGKVRERVDQLANDLDSTQTLLRNIISQLSLNSDQLLAIAPPPNPSYLERGYAESLFSHYHAYMSQYGALVQRGAEPCLSVKVDIKGGMDQRRDSYNRLFQDVARAYVSAYRKKIEASLQERIPESIDVALSVRESLLKMDLAYQTAITKHADYFQAIEILRSYEDVSSVLLGMLVPQGASLEVRRAAELEVNVKLKQARKALEYVNQYKPSQWLTQKYQRIQARIQKGSLDCNSTCRSKMHEAESLIASASIMEDVTSSKTHALMASDLLHQIERQQ